MEHRAFVGVLAALVSVGPQSSAADASGTQERDGGWTKTAEAGVSVVPKMPRTAPSKAVKAEVLADAVEQKSEVKFMAAQAKAEKRPYCQRHIIDWILAHERVVDGHSNRPWSK
jgi:hypothetical protein